MAPTEQVTVVGGPSKFDLMAALMVGDMRNRLPITLELKPDAQSHTKVEVIVNGMIREDGSGDKWIITGYRITELGWTIRPKLEHWIPVKCFFSSQTRTGFFEELAE